jgi:hypothetical protein
MHRFGIVPQRLLRKPFRVKHLGVAGFEVTGDTTASRNPLFTTVLTA